MFGRVHCHAFRARLLPLSDDPGHPCAADLVCSSRLQGRLCLLLGLAHGGQHRAGRGPREGWGEGALQNTASVFAYGCVKVAVCANGSCDEGSAYRIFQRKKEKSFSRDEILGSLESQRTVGALFLPPPSVPPTPPLPFRSPSLPPSTPPPPSACFHIRVINIGKCTVVVFVPT